MFRTSRISFVFLVGLFPLKHAAKGAIIWWMLFLAALTYLVARERKVQPMLEVFKHLLVASAVVMASTQIPHLIDAVLG